MDQNQVENESRALFSRLREREIEAPGFMKARILARLEQPKRGSIEVMIWRLVAGLSTSALALVSWFHFSGSAGQDSAKFVSMQPYVIHLDLGGERLTGSAIAEIELPPGVKFVSKAHPEVAEMRSMRMQLPGEIEGRSRLPFVVMADKPGHKDLKLKILDVNGRMLESRVVSVTFTGSGAKVL